MNEELNHIQPNSTVGPYRIVRRFKRRGGMAGIFEVEVREKYRQPGLPRRLALKVAREKYQGALVAETDFLRRFDHPNVVRIFPLAGYHRPIYAARERFPFGWGWYYTMELLSGKSLERRLTHPTASLLRSPPNGGSRRLSILEALGIGRQLAAALQHVHERFVINLDVKPGNVLFRQRRLRFLRGSVPQAVLCDFGVSRDLRYPRTGLLGVATPEYVSPEQTTELSRHYQQLDGRSDIFSLGIVLYEMLTGTLPFENVALAADPTYAPAPPRQLRRSLPPLLEETVLRALTKDPNHRFQTASQVRAALAQVPTPPDWGAVARYGFAGGALVACLAAGGLGVTSGVRFLMQAPIPVPPAVAETATATPTAAPTTLVPTAISPTATRRVLTSTPAPTFTPTNTPRPRTPTPTPEGEGG
jgi:serine/threonine protein kinase